jgi:NAD(P)H dehydrogenase (quinone)
MPEKKILVTGSTGATGTPTVRLLLERGLAVRALVRRQDQRSELLESLGAEIMEGDLLDYNAVRGMLEGVDRALFVFPVRPGLLDATAYFAQAAAEAALDVVVNLSQRTARRDTESHAAQNHWIAEQVFDQFAAPVVHLRPTFFADWFLYFTYMVKAGVVRFPFGTGRHAPITATDRARVAAAVLAEPESHMGHTYELYGSSEMTFPEMTAAIGATLGKDLTYDRVDFDDFVDDARSHGRDFNEFFVQHLRAVTDEHQAGLLAGHNDVVKKIGGQPPTTIEEFARANRKAFE